MSTTALENSPVDVQDAVAAKRLAADIIGNWPADRNFDACGLIGAHSDLAACRSAVLDLAYEQYCRDRDAGIAIDRDSFAGRFPAHRRTLLKLLDVHEELEKHPAVLPANVSWPEAECDFLGFELLAELGRGSFSRVFLAKETEVGGRNVVVKVCSEAGREVSILGTLEHPHICQVFSVRQDADTGLTAICMPFVGTQTLMDVIDAGFAKDQSGKESSATVADPAHISLIAKLGSQVAGALAYTHERGIVHGDIKPSNIIVSDDGAKLIDFNLSTHHDKDEPLLGGTLVYMAPEQLAQMSEGTGAQHCTPATDVFSMGVTIFESITGRLPYGKPTPGLDRRAAIAELLDLQAVLQQSSESEWADGLGDLAQVVLPCLSCDPAARPTAAKLADTLSSLVLTRPTQRRPVMRRAARWGTVGMLIVASGMAIPAMFKPVEYASDPAVPEVTPRVPRITTADALDRAWDAIQIDQFVEADRLLALVPMGVRHSQILAAMGYCKAQIADAKNAPQKLAFKNAKAAIVLFEAAIQEGHPQRELLLDNIGYCRIIANRTRPLKFKPDSPPKDFRDLSQSKMRDTLINEIAKAYSKRIEFKGEFPLFDFAARRYSRDSDIQLNACEYHALGVRLLPNRTKYHTQYVIEYAWCALALDRSGRTQFVLSRRLQTIVQITDHPEYARLIWKRKKPLTLWIEDKPLRSR